MTALMPYPTDLFPDGQRGGLAICSIRVCGEEVATLAQADVIVGALLGPGRTVEQAGPGGWLVWFSERELARLRIWGTRVWSDGLGLELEVEMP